MDRVDAMLAAMAPYGPGIASWTDAGVSLGRRYAVDAGAAPRERNAPALEPDGSGAVVVAAARLDDREALCDALGLPPAARAAHDDHALISKAYRRWGGDCPNHLLGDYAFALWDGKRRSLFCARDHAGTRPLYYAETRWGFVFGSDVEAVLAGPGVGRELDEFMAGMYLLRRVEGFPETRTFFRAVRRLPPGHGLVVEDGAVRLQRYWRPEDVPAAAPASDDEHAEAFLDLYARAVKDRLHGSGRIGVHLSGGLDSSSVTALAARELRRQGRTPPPAFTWLPPLGAAPPAEQYAWEYEAVAAVAGQEGLQVLHCAPTGADVLAWLRQDAAFPHARVFINERVVERRAAAHGVRVLLSGLGGDEGISYNGRGRYASLLRSGRWASLFAEARVSGFNPLKVAVGTALRLLPYGPELFRYKKLLRRWLRGQRGARSRHFIHPAFARERRLPLKPLFWPTSVRNGQLELLTQGFSFRRVEALATSGPRHGLEYRHPLLDRRVLELALSLPPEQFIRGPTTRYLMRHALDLKAVLPPAVCWHESKLDPARLDALFAAWLEALPSIRRRLAVRAAPPHRARYVDVPRLLEWLAPAALGERTIRSGIPNALHFLDWQDPVDGDATENGPA